MTEIRVRPGSSRVWLGPQVGEGRYKVQEHPGGGFLLEPIAPNPGPPGRFVDRFGRGWLTRPAHPGDVNPPCAVFPALDEEAIGEQVWPYTRVAAERGPLRPVDIPPDDDLDRLAALLACARTKAVGTLLLALHMLREKCEKADTHPLRLVAGRPGSWESADLLTLTRVCVPAAEVEHHVASFEQPRPGGPVLDQPGGVVEEVYKVLHRWLFDPATHVELAETLAQLVGKVVDGRGGWDQVTTAQLRSTQWGALAEKLLRSRSRYYPQHR